MERASVRRSRSNDSVQELDQQENERLSQEPSREIPNLEETSSSLVQDKSPVLQTATLYASLAMFSIAGAATRIGLTYLTSYDGQPVFGLLAAQAVGCAVMGWNVRNRDVIERFPALFIGIGTGYCGSTTTFSTWMFQTFQAFSNDQHYQHNGLKNAVAGLTQLYVTFAISTASLRFGLHGATLTALLISRPNPNHSEAEKVSPSKSAFRVPPRYVIVLRILTIIFAILLWLCVILITVYRHSFRHITLSLVLAPLGTWLRYVLAQLNPGEPSFPRGTFTANVLASAIDATVYLLQRSGAARADALGCSALQGVADGFCGCLSTVSTFATEIRGLRRKHAYRYALASIFAGQAVVVLIYGSYRWSRRLEPSCSFYENAVG